MTRIPEELGQTAHAPAVRIAGLHKAFEGETVIENLDLEVAHGECAVILGPSGCGKSTLLRSLLGLEPPDRGRVEVLDTDVYACDERALDKLRQQTGVAFQDNGLFSSLSLAENIELPLAEFSDLPASTRHILVQIKLGMVDLLHAKDRSPGQLSGGMKKRAAVARAMALGPDILFLDEPSAGLDPITAAGLDRLLLELKALFDITMIVVTHELESAFTIGDRIHLMDRGRIIVSGTPGDLRHTREPSARRFLDRQPAAASRQPVWGMLEEEREDRVNNGKNSS